MSTQQKTYTSWPTPTGLGAAEMYGYETMLQLGPGTCALEVDSVKGRAIDSARNKVTIDRVFFDNRFFCNFIFLLFLWLTNRLGIANKPGSPIVSTKKLHNWLKNINKEFFDEK
jgi:hypothetical protein